MGKDKPIFRANFRLDQFGWTKYKLEGVGFGEVGAVHRGKKADVPTRLSNELISGKIAQFLQLPIPPFGFSFFKKTEGVDLVDQVLFSQLDFNYERENPPPPEWDFCFEMDKSLCSGILLFDILVVCQSLILG